MQREVKERDKDGVQRVKISYPKFKNGEATVQDARITPNFGKSYVYLKWAYTHADSHFDEVLCLLFFFHRLCRWDISNLYESKQRRFEGCCLKYAREDPCSHEYNAGETAKRRGSTKESLKEQDGN